MGTLERLFEYNTWANLRVFEFCRMLDAETLRRDAPGTAGTGEGTLKHLVQVEDVYLLMLHDIDPSPTARAREEMIAQSLPWFANRAAELGEAYRELLSRADEHFLGAELRVPWFDFALTKHDGVLQVVHHSAQHRAQALSALGGWGVEGPDVDYVDFVELMDEGSG
jgi:uncharacterized damage-inducible protein DinB